MTTTTEANVATTQVYRVYIRATPEAIWDAITKPEWSQKYGYGGSVDYDLRPGGQFRAFTSQQMRDVGAPDLAIDGEVIEADRPRRLVLSWRMVMDEAMTAEGFTRLTYDIEESQDGVSKLTLTHELEGAPKLAALLNGEMEAQGAGGGWSWVLSDLKTLLETGTPFAS
jgi:uncharacterized protein YndB with AHSA1/START domain